MTDPITIHFGIYTQCYSPRMGISFGKTARHWLNCNYAKVYRQGRNVFIVSSTEYTTFPPLGDTTSTIGSSSKDKNTGSVTKSLSKLGISIEKTFVKQPVKAFLVEVEGSHAISFVLPDEVRIVENFIDSTVPENQIPPNVVGNFQEKWNDDYELKKYAESLLVGHDSRFAMRLMRALMKEAKRYGVSEYRLDEKNNLRAIVTNLI